MWADLGPQKPLESLSWLSQMPSDDSADYRLTLGLAGRVTDFISIFDDHYLASVPCWAHKKTGLITEPRESL